MLVRYGEPGCCAAGMMGCMDAVDVGSVYSDGRCEWVLYCVGEKIDAGACDAPRRYRIDIIRKALLQEESASIYWV